MRATSPSRELGRSYPAWEAVEYGTPMGSRPDGGSSMIPVIAPQQDVGSIPTHSVPPKELSGNIASRSVDLD